MTTITAIELIRSVQDRDVERNLISARQTLLCAIKEAAAGGARRLKINAFIPNCEGPERSAMFRAMNLLGSEGFKIESVYGGQAGMARNYGEFYAYFISW